MVQYAYCTEANLSYWSHALTKGM